MPPRCRTPPSGDVIAVGTDSANSRAAYAYACGQRAFATRPFTRDWTHPLPAFYLYAPSREQMPRKVRALIDFLVEKREAIPRG